MRNFLAGLFFALLMTGSAPAGPSADLLTRHLEAGTLEDGIAAIIGDDAEANAARGTLKFLLAIEHAYPTRTVRLHFRTCAIHGEPQPLLGQEMQWVRRAELGALQFPDADRELIELLLH